MEVKFAPGFEKSMDKLFSWKYAPYRAIKWVLRIPRELKWFFQRGFRGYAECDGWDLDNYIINWLPQALLELTKGCSYPSEFKNIKSWHKVLREMSSKLKRRVEEDKMLSEEDIKKFNEGMDLFKKYFFHLWD